MDLKCHPWKENSQQFYKASSKLPQLYSAPQKKVSLPTFFCSLVKGCGRGREKVPAHNRFALNEKKCEIFFLLLLFPSPFSIQKSIVTKREHKKKRHFCMMLNVQKFVKIFFCRLLTYRHYHKVPLIFFLPPGSILFRNESFYCKALLFF